jgi:hypothetical protein
MLRCLRWIDLSKGFRNPIEEQFGSQFGGNRSYLRSARESSSSRRQIFYFPAKS